MFIEKLIIENKIFQKRLKIAVTKQKPFGSKFTTLSEYQINIKLSFCW